MEKVKTATTLGNSFIWTAAILAALACVSYIMVSMGLLSIGDLNQSEDGGIVVFIAAGCYFAGGLLTLLRRKWLWIIGLLINALVIFFFFNIYQDRPLVMFSPAGLATKIPQLLLELNLLFLVLRMDIKKQSNLIKKNERNYR